MIKGTEAVPTLAPARTPRCPASSSELPAFSTSVPSVPAPGRCTGGRDDEHNAVADKKGQVQMAGNEPVDTSCNYDRQQEAGCVQEGELPARNLIQPLVHGPPSFQREDRREPPPGQRIKPVGAEAPARVPAAAAAFGQERAGQLRVVPGVRRTPPLPPRWRLARTVWRGSVQSGLMFIWVVCWLSGFLGGHGLGHWWWTRLVLGSHELLRGVTGPLRTAGGNGAAFGEGAGHAAVMDLNDAAQEWQTRGFAVLLGLSRSASWPRPG
jgi:hypothetical protein